VGRHEPQVKEDDMSASTPTIPEFSLGIGTRQHGNAVNLFADYIFVIGAGNDSYIYQTLYATSTGFDAANLTDQSLWQSSQVQLKNLFKPQTGNLCAAVVLGGDAPAMYLAWNQANVGILAAPCTGVSQPSGGGSTAPVPVWGNGFLLRDQSGNVPTMRGNGCDVCGTSLGSAAFLIAYPVEANGQPAVFFGLYYVADQTPGTMVQTAAGSFAAWNARASVVLTASSMASLPGNGPGTDIYDTGGTVSIVTVPYVASGATTNDNQLSLALVAFMTVDMDKYANGESGSKTNKFWWPMQLMLPLDQDGAPLLSGTPAPQTIWTAGSLPKSNLTAVCDPAGRIVSCSASQDWPTENLQVLTFGVFQTYTMPPSLAPDGILTVAPSAASPQPPSQLFLVDAGTTSAPVTNVTGNGQMTTTTYPVYILAFYAANTVAQLVDYGSIEVTNNYAWGSPLVPSGSGSVVAVAATGIIDGPIPVPNQNIAGWQFESTNNDLGSIAFGTQVNAGTQTQQSYNWNVGFKTEGSETFGFAGADLGVAWDASLSGGKSKIWGTSDASTLWSTFTQTSIVNVPPPPNPSQIGIGIDPYASLWVADEGVSFNSFRFVNANGMVISDGSLETSSYTPLAPIQGTSVPAPKAVTQSPYVPYMVTPGNLMSYTIDGPSPDAPPCNINATMERLSGISNYFENIIWPGAYTFTVGGVQQKYLLFAWDIGQVYGQGFTNVTGTVSTSSWQIDASYYVGFTWDMSIGVPDILGVKAQGQFLVGGSGGYSSSTTTTTSDQWGIAIAPPPGASPPFGPPNWGMSPNDVDPSLQEEWDAAVAKYEFALFFLPDPTADSPAPLMPGYWVQELIKYGNTNATTFSPAAYLPEHLDPNVGCWKIVYVVLSIQTNADLNNNPPTYTYCYQDPNGWFGGSFCVAENAARRYGARAAANSWTSRPSRRRPGKPEAQSTVPR
jgi:hypothetical protein